MALRKAAAYSKKKVRPYTRKSKVQQKSYIKTVPPSKIVKFQMGDIKGFENNKFKYILKLLSKEKVQIRDNAIEAVRLVTLKNLDKEMPGMYYLQVKIHPHHVLRENKMLTGAGSDRMQTGMQKSFGSTVGRAAIVPKDKEILVIGVHTKKQANKAREILRMNKPKLPCKTRIILEERKH